MKTAVILVCLVVLAYLNHRFPHQMGIVNGAALLCGLGYFAYLYLRKPKR